MKRKPIVAKCDKCKKTFTSALRAHNHQSLCGKSKAEKQAFHKMMSIYSG